MGVDRLDVSLALAATKDAHGGAETHGAGDTQNGAQQPENNLQRGLGDNKRKNPQHYGCGNTGKTIGITEVFLHT